MLEASVIITAFPSGTVWRLSSQRSIIASVACVRVSWMWRRSWAWYCASAEGYVEGSLARIVEAAAAERPPTLPSVKAEPGFLCGLEFDSLSAELAFFARHGLRIDDAEIDIDLQPGELLLFDNLVLVHGRRGRRQPGELRQRVFGHRLQPADQRKLRDRVLTAFDTLADYWGVRDMRARHHPMFIHEFGETSLVVRDESSRITAYLFGFVAPAGVGYMHLVGVRADSRRAGLGRRLYGEFETLARDRGATALKAISIPTNHDSIAFRHALDMSATEVADYSGPGQPRVVFWRDLSK
jgi:GNAT superfamily N-acetyltransferase